MAAETIGMFNPIWRVRQVRVSVSAGTTSLRAGTSRTSSKVSPSGSASGIIEDSFHDSVLAPRYEALKSLHCPLLTPWSSAHYPALVFRAARFFGADS